MVSKQSYIYRLSSDDKILSSLIKKKIALHALFLNHLMEANEQKLCALFKSERLCCHSVL